MYYISLNIAKTINYNKLADVFQTIILRNYKFTLSMIIRNIKQYTRDFLVQLHYQKHYKPITTQEL